MPPQTMLQIVSGFKPSVDGMGDFARRLGDVLGDRRQIRSHFFVFRKPKAIFDAGKILPNTLSYAAEPTPRAAMEAISALRGREHFDCALLHYGPYAYSSIGEPAAFVSQMEQLAGEMPVLVFFHELYASGPPWKRAFWTHRQQKACVERLLALSSAAFTSNRKYMLRLEALNRAERPVCRVPIFSNIGEPAGLRPLDQRSRRLVMFGQLATRVRLYREHLQALESICRILRIESVVDVGSGQSAYLPAKLAGLPLETMGWMDEEKLSLLMADSIAGVVGYWPDVWEKSGIVAAYQAHALVPILVELEPRRIPAPRYLPYILPSQIAGASSEGKFTSDATLQQIADASYAYYMQNQSVNRCAEAIATAATAASGETINAQTSS